MPEGLTSRVRLFADDTVAYVAVTSDADTNKLQEDLDKLAKWETTWLMKFHPEKCNVLTITKNRNIIKKEYILHGHKLEHVTSAKYLGVTLTSDLKWSQHVNNICAKANSTIGFLKRNLNISNKVIKECSYKTLVRPSLEYASAALDPYNMCDIRKLDMVQRRAARYTLNRYHNTSSVTDMIEQLGWESLQDRRKNARLTMMYKLRNNKTKVETTEKLIPSCRQTRNNNTEAMQIPSCRTSIRKESFYPRTIRDWNTLPTETVQATSLDAFKARLKN